MNIESGLRCLMLLCLLEGSRRVEGVAEHLFYMIALLWLQERA